MQLSHVLYFDIKGHFWVTSAAFIACSATVVLIPVESFYLGLVWLVSVRPVTVQPLELGFELCNNLYPAAYLFW